MSSVKQQAIISLQRKQRLANDRDRQREDAIGRVHTVSGEFVVDGTGEALVPVNFPIRFIEKPRFHFGGELAPDSVITDGEFPTVSAVVGYWTYEERPYVPHYKGATLAVVTTGPTGQKMAIHWTMTGRAITNPVSSGDSADSTV
jgi:hypothetical protein